MRRLRWRWTRRTSSSLRRSLLFLLVCESSGGPGDHVRCQPQHERGYLEELHRLPLGGDLQVPGHESRSLEALQVHMDEWTAQLHLPCEQADVDPAAAAREGGEDPQPVRV